MESCFTWKIGRRNTIDTIGSEIVSGCHEYDFSNKVMYEYHIKQLVFTMVHNTGGNFYGWSGGWCGDKFVMVF